MDTLNKLIAERDLPAAFATHLRGMPNREEAIKYAMTFPLSLAGHLPTAPNESQLPASTIAQLDRSFGRLPPPTAAMLARASYDANTGILYIS